MISNPVQVVGKQLPRHVIRMWDERVFAPEFLKGNMEHSFNIDDPESIEDCLAAVEGRLRRTLGQQDWQELTTACFQKEEGHDEAKLRRRDILEWLFRGDRRSTPNVTHALVSQEKPAQKGSVK